MPLIHKITRNIFLQKLPEFHSPVRQDHENGDLRSDKKASKCMKQLG